MYALNILICSVGWLNIVMPASEEKLSRWWSCFLASCRHLSRVRTHYSQWSENRVYWRHGGVVCVPCFTFPKAKWNGSALSFPALTVSPVPMTGASSAAFFTLSNMDFSGRMLPRNMVRTRHCTIGSSGGAGSVFSAGSSPSWQTRRPLMARWWLTPLTSRPTARRQVCAKRGLRASHRPDKGRIEFQTPCGLRRTWAACSAFADRRTGQRLQGSGHSPAPSSQKTASFWQTEGMMRPGCGSLWKRGGWRSAYLLGKPEIQPFLSTKRCINVGISLKIRSANWRTGGVSQHVMTAVPIPFSQPSALLSVLSFIFINESWP